MKFVTFAGPPSSGKTSVILKCIEYFKKDEKKVGAVKFDCLSTTDGELYKKMDVPVTVGLAGRLCPDHFFITHIDDCVKWGKKNNFDLLVCESAGLCNRCSPHIKDVLAVCVIDNLSGINTPKKIGPMLKFADIVVITKGDIVSQAEREVFYYHIKKANPLAQIIAVNGITGQGAYALAKKIMASGETATLINKHLRFTMPSGVCSYCIGQTKISDEEKPVGQGNIRYGEVNNEG